jgi:hypothetical protein
MNIEFYTPSREVSEPLVATVRNAIMHQHKLHNEVSKAEVSFAQRRKIVTTEKICEIRFVISGRVNIVTGTRLRVNLLQSPPKTDTLGEPPIIPLRSIPLAPVSSTSRIILEISVLNSCYSISVIPALNSR